MILRSLEVDGFRNLQAGRVEPGDGVNLFWGRNGAGKTNLLEAVYYLFTTRSFRARRTIEMVVEGGEGFRLAGEVESGASFHRVEVVQGRAERELYLDGKRAGLEDLLRRFSVLAFSSHQMNVLRGGPGDRRRFLDRGILGLRPAYLRDLADYNRTLAQRNRLLRNGLGVGRAERQAWDERFVTAGARLMEARRKFSTELSEKIAVHAGDLLPDGWNLSLDYRADAWRGADRGPAVDALRARAKETAAGEARMGHSLFGPHRDDARVFAGGRDLTRFGSGGQQRLALLALKLTRMEMMREVRGEPPLLLVDDIDSDLDDEAAGRLLDRAACYQALVTTCRDDSRQRHAAAAHGFRVREGRVTALANERMTVPADGE